MSHRPLWPWIVVPAVAVGALLLALTGRYPEALDDGQTRLSLTYSVLLLALLGGSAAVHWRARPASVFKNAALWLAIGAALVLAYGYRHDAEAVWRRLAAQIVPDMGAAGTDTITYHKSRGGHFVVAADVEGVTVHFLVDTGASDVVLSPTDARRLGLDPESLDYSRRYATANGTVDGAPLTLRSLRVGPITLEGVRASVNRAEMTRSLLGMSFLGRLSGFEVSGETLTLTR